MACPTERVAERRPGTRYHEQKRHQSRQSAQGPDHSLLGLFSRFHPGPIQHVEGQRDADGARELAKKCEDADEEPLAPFARPNLILVCDVRDHRPGNHVRRRVSDAREDREHDRDEPRPFRLVDEQTAESEDPTHTAPDVDRRLVPASREAQPEGHRDDHGSQEGSQNDLEILGSSDHVGEIVEEESHRQIERDASEGVESNQTPEAFVFRQSSEIGADAEGRLCACLEALVGDLVNRQPRQKNPRRQYGPRDRPGSRVSSERLCQRFEAE